MSFPLYLYESYLINRWILGEDFYHEAHFYLSWYIFHRGLVVYAQVYAVILTRYGAG